MLIAVLLSCSPPAGGFLASRFAGKVLAESTGNEVVPAPAGSVRSQQSRPTETPEKDAGGQQAPEKTREGQAAGDSGPKVEIRLSLDEAIAIAMDNNLGIQIARVNLNIQQRQVVVERAVFDPFFNLGASYSKNRRPSASVLEVGGVATPEVVVNPFEVTTYSTGLSGITVLGTSYTISLNESGFDRPVATSGGLFGINPQEELSGSFQLTQPLLRGAWYDSNSAQIRIASNNERLSREDLELTANALVFGVEQAYWELVFAITNYESKDKALQVATENLDNVRKKRAVGTMADIDVITADSQLALRKVEFNEAALLREDARDALLDVLNRTGGESLKVRWESGEKGKPYEQVEVIPVTEPNPEPLVPDRDRSLESAFGRRPDYRRIAVELENQRIRLEFAANQLLPFLDLTASWFQHGLDDSFEGAFSSMGSGQFYSWSVGLALRMPLSNRGPRNILLQAQGELDRFELQRAQLENQIVLDVDRSIRTLESLHERVQDLDRRVELQAELLDKEKKKLEVGKSIPYTVSIIENDLVDSQAQSLRAKADYQTAKADYYRLTGEILERHGVDSLLP